MINEETERLRRELEFHREANALAIHDLKNPASYLATVPYIMNRLLDRLSEKVSLVTNDPSILQDIFDLRRSINTSASKSTRVCNSVEILTLNEIVFEELNKLRWSFKPYEVLCDDISSYEHEMISLKNLGLNLAFSDEARKLELYTNKPALSSVFSNIVGNAVKYAYPSSVINSTLVCEDGRLVFELENMVGEKVDADQLMHVFEKGYREDGENEFESKIGTDQGIGLYFVNKIVKQGFLGEVSVRSSDSFYITEERTKDLLKRDKPYGVPHKPSFIPFPSFYINVSIPLEKITKKPKKTTEGLEEVVSPLD